MLHRRSRSPACLALMIALDAAQIACGIAPLHAAEPHPLLDALMTQVGDTSGSVDADGRIITDCSGYSIDYLDAHSPDPNRVHDIWLGNLQFEWREVPDADGYCFYLIRPERLGLRREQARAVLVAPSMKLAAPFAPVDFQAGCSDSNALYASTLLPSAPDRTEQGIGYRFGATLVDFARDPALAPLAAVQGAFMRELLDETQQKPYVPRPLPPPDPSAQQLTITSEEPAPPPPPPGTNVTGLAFMAHRIGPLASLEAQWNMFVQGDSGPVHATHRFWLLHVPTGRIVSFDDLFAHPDEVRKLLIVNARPFLAKRWGGMMVNGRSDEERAAERSHIDAAIAHATSEEAARDWLVSIDLLNPCKPALLVTMDPVDSDMIELAQMPLAIDGAITQAMKPEYVAAFRAAATH